ncbi:MAG TPA: alpha/beta hydrolase [Myxococcales bacterium]|nr:alpha/beta hydrolase [Myxococcales bacterium]
MSAEPVVLLHGLCAAKQVWRAQVEHLAKSRRVIAYDQLGHGEAPRAPRYTIEILAEDLARKTEPLGRFWLAGHSMAGAVVSAFAARHPERLAGIVYVDAVGDMTGAPPEMRAWFLDNAGMDLPRMRVLFDQMLGPLAKPQTRAEILAGLERCDIQAFVQLRESLLAQPKPRPFDGPLVAIEAAGPDNPFLASHLPGARRLELTNVSHWLMLDDPQAVNAALDEALAWTK